VEYIFFSVFTVHKFIAQLRQLHKFSIFMLQIFSTIISIGHVEHVKAVIGNFRSADNPLHVFQLYKVLHIV